MIRALPAGPSVPKFSPPFVAMTLEIQAKENKMHQSKADVRHLIIAISLALAASRMSASAQVAPSQSLQPYTGVLKAEFSKVVSVRELRDGRILIADGRAQRVVLGDFATGVVTQVGRNGLGPGEYDNVFQLYPLGGDSTLMPEHTAGRWLIFDGPRVVRTVLADDPALAAAGASIVGADSLGFVVSRRSARMDPARPASLDSISLIRVSTKTAAVDTIANILRRSGDKLVRAEPNGSVVVVVQPTADFPSEEEALFQDGWLAIARVNPYRVDWRSPNGNWTHGVPLPFTQVPLDMKERHAYSERITSAGGLTPPAHAQWPATVPPFERTHPFESPLLQSPDGTLLIARAPTGR